MVHSITLFSLILVLFKVKYSIDNSEKKHELWNPAGIQVRIHVQKAPTTIKYWNEKKIAIKAPKINKEKERKEN